MSRRDVTEAEMAIRGAVSSGNSMLRVAVHGVDGDGGYLTDLGGPMLYRIQRMWRRGGVAVVTLRLLKPQFDFVVDLRTGRSTRPFAHDARGDYYHQIYWGPLKNEVKDVLNLERLRRIHPGWQP